MARTVLVLCFCLAAILAVAADDNCNSFWCSTDLNLFEDKEPVPIEDLIKQFGYPVELHEIETADGYLLTYHRIPRGKNSNASLTNPVPVLLQHGMLAASSCWVLFENALAFTLADQGYDVWLGNARGNTYSRKHTKLDPDEDKKEFWNFSWHEMGHYDLPASIDYILEETGKKQLFYIGHSMGTTMYFVLGSTRPQYMEKIQAAVLLAPVAFPWNIRSPLSNFLNRLQYVFNAITTHLGVYEVLPYTERMFWLDKYVCGNPKFQFICRDILLYLGGFNENELKMISLKTIFEYTPAGASYKELRHFQQIGEEGTDFQQYDHGRVKNLWIYWSRHPPVYNLTNVVSPLYVYYGMNDWLAVPEDVLYAVQHLPNVQKVTKVSDDRFNHLHFIWAFDAKTLVYDDIISTLQDLTVAI